MKYTISILMVVIISIMILPWQFVCLAHPTGHTHHHEPGKLSPCEQRKLSTETSFWPPMDCYKLAFNADNYLLPQNDKLTPNVNTPANTAVLLQVIKVDFPEVVFLQLPTPMCRSGTLLSGHLLRAPPNV